MEGAHDVDVTTQPLSGAVFRDVMGRFASGVTVITAPAANGQVGTTASAVTSLSLEPPMVLVCLNRTSNTGAVLSQTKKFAINILSEDQDDLARLFASKSADKFAGLSPAYGPAGLPVLADALATIECEVTAEVAAGTHTVFLARALTAVARSGAPLAYFGGQFGGISLADTTGAYTKLRNEILNGALAPDSMIDASTTAQRLATPTAPIHIALGQLIAEGLVLQSSDGLSVAKLDWGLFDDALEARRAIELGVIDLTVGRLSLAQLEEFRHSCHDWAPVSAGGDTVALEQRHSQSIGFHDLLVSFAGSSRLLDVYRELELPSVLIRTFHDYELSERDEVFGEDHLELLAAYETKDLNRARSVTVRHLDRIKEAARPLWGN